MNLKRKEEALGDPAGPTAEGETQSCDFRVGGMDCPSCAEAIERPLAGLEGVQDVRVDVLGGKVRVTYAEGKLARGDLTGAIRRVGYQVEEEDARRSVFVIPEMDCAEEVRQVESKLVDCRVLRICDSICSRTA